MANTSLLQIFKVNDARSGVKDGRPWSMQDAECAILDDDGVMQQVGVLPLPKHMMGDVAPKPGVYLGSFALMAGMKDRRIGSVLTGLTPYEVRKPAAAAAVAAKVPS